MGYKSFDEAVRGNRSTPCAAAARETTQQIAGRSIVDACWDDAHFAILLSAERCIHFSAMNGEVYWELITPEQFAGCRLSWNSDPEPIRLVRHRLKDQQIMTNEMDRSGILRQLTGKHVRRLLTNEFGVYLHIQGDRQYLCLHGGTFSETKLQFLEWFVDED